MRRVVVEFANSKHRERFKVGWEGTGVVAAQNATAHWLQQAVRAAFESGACVTFSVSVHQDGPDCEHEVPRG